MKRIFCLILVVCLFLSGCSSFGERIKEPVTFYYLCSQYQEDLCCVISSEEWEASGHRNDLSFLLHLYLMGPSSDGLDSPLPYGTQILSVEQKDSRILLELTDTVQSLSDVEFTLACACLTLTCLDLTDAAEVTIQSGNRTTTMNRSSLSLYDTNEPTPTEETK